jgi:hypothetical protein
MLARQIMFLDLLELGDLSRPSNFRPRVKLFDYEIMKKMVDKISVNLGGDISYHNANVSPHVF